MNRELLDRIHDQACTEMGFCVQAKDGNWCDRHEALKFPGEEACRVLSVAYVVAESAVEVAEPLIRAQIAADIEASPIPLMTSPYQAAEAARFHAARIARGPR